MNALNFIELRQNPSIYVSWQKNKMTHSNFSWILLVTFLGHSASVFLCIRISVCLHLIIAALSSLCIYFTLWPRSILDDLPAVYERHRQMTTSKRWYEKKEWQHTLKPDKVISYEWMMLAWRLLKSLGRSTVAPGLPSFFERKRRRWIEETMKSATSMDFSLIPL